MRAAESAPSHCPEDQERSDRFRGVAGFADYQHQRFPRIHRVDRRLDERRVHVVQNDESPARFREGALDRMRAARSAIERPCSKRAAADAHQAHRIDTAHAGRKLRDRLDQFAVEGQMREAVRSGLALSLEARQGFAGRTLVAPHLTRGYPVRASHSGEQVGLVKTNAHTNNLQEPRRNRRLLPYEVAVGFFCSRERLGDVVVPGKVLFVHQRPENAEA